MWPGCDIQSLVNNSLVDHVICTEYDSSEPTAEPLLAYEGDIMDKGTRVIANLPETISPTSKESALSTITIIARELKNCKSLLTLTKFTYESQTGVGLHVHGRGVVRFDKDYGHQGE